MIEREDIQGLALFSYGWQPFACWFLVSFEGGDARAFVSRLLNDVSSAASAERRERRRRNIAFTPGGLRALGLGEEWLESFPREFLQGMAHPERSLSLGDTGGNAPVHWDFGGAEAPVDALLCVYAPTESELDRESDAVEALLSRYRLSAETEEANWPADGRDHFGVPLSNAEPRIGGFAWRRRQRRLPRVSPGEIVLGYRNAGGALAEGPRGPVRFGTRPRPRLSDYGRAVDLGHNGTYLAVRKLEQDVPAYLERAGSATPPAASAPDASRAPLLRERVFGERYDASTPGSADVERGKLVLAVNANLRRQFESAQGVRLAMAASAPLGAEACMRVRGGLYLFMPGLTALGYLTEL